LVTMVFNMHSVHRFVYLAAYSSQYRDAGRAREIKIETAVSAACKGILPSCHFGHVCRRFVRPGLDPCDFLQ